MYEKNFEEKNLVPLDPLGVPRVPISGPNRGIFSKLNGPGPLGSGGHSHTSFSTGEFRAAQRTLSSDVPHTFRLRPHLEPTNLKNAPPTGNIIPRDCLYRIYK